MSDLIIFGCEQNSPEWYECRRGVPTSSRFKDILAEGKGKTRRRYLLDLAAEILTSECVEHFSNDHTERGHIMEDDARQLYTFERNTEPVRCGFMKRGRIGCSPDSLLGEDGLLEIKTKLGALQLDVLEYDRLPPEHRAQVQGQLWVSGRDWCDFVSYWPRLPLFVKRVERDEKYIQTLAQAVADFVGELDALVKKYSPQELEEAA